MAILRAASVDIIVTLFIVLSTSMDLLWGRWILWFYTALMVLLKLAALSSRGLRNITTQKKKTDEPPVWIFHVLYAINVVVLGLAGWWYLFIGWGLIWILSILIEHRS